MAVKIPCTFFVRGDQYELIATAGGNILDFGQFPTPPNELQMASHATYEIIFDALYLVLLTIKEEKVRYLPVGGVDRTGDSLPVVYQGLSMVVPFSGKIRLARGFIDEPCINMSYQRALAFEVVLDIALKERASNCNEESLSRNATETACSERISRIPGQIAKHRRHATNDLAENNVSPDLPIRCEGNPYTGKPGGYGPDEVRPERILRVGGQAGKGPLQVRFGHRP